MTNPAHDAVDLHSRIARLESRIELLEDEKAIRELLARYGYHADNGLDEFFDLFTEDCVMDVSKDDPDHPGAVVVWQGKEALREFLSIRTARHGAEFVGHSFHVQGNNLDIRISGFEAVATGYSFILRGADGEIRLVSASFNEWRLRKQHCEWLVQSRVRRSAGAPDIAARITTQMAR